MTLLVLALFLLGPLHALGTDTDLGSGLWRDYMVFAPLPTNSSVAMAEGWDPHKNTSTGRPLCYPKLGIRFSQRFKKNHPTSGPTMAKPISLYFTPAGQLAGVGTVAYGKFDAAGAAVAQGYWKPVDDGTPDKWRIDVTFRGADAVCAEGLSPGLLGDRAVINADTIARALPMRQQDAIAQQYETGSCFASMGTHSFMDLKGPGGNMTWGIDNLMPVVAMYDRNADWRLNAVFFATPFVQQSAWPPSSNQWEPIPLPNIAMCANFCDPKCGWKDTSFWSTMHIYFSDPHKVVCENNCKLGCCENN